MKAADAIHKLALIGVAAASMAVHSQTQSAAVVVYEGARLIIGDEPASIENGTFVVRDGRIAALGAPGGVATPRGAKRVKLTGKTVIPALINSHADVGYERFTTPGGDSLLASYPNNFTTENVIDRLERYAYGARRLEAVTNVDVRVDKTLSLSRGSVSVYVDVFNLLNANSTLGINDVTGPRFEYPLYILSPRIMKVGASFSF